MLLDSREPVDYCPTIITGMGLASLGIFGVQAAWGVELFGVTNRYTKMAFAKALGSHSVWRDCTTYRLCATLVLRALVTIAIYFAFMAAVDW